MKKLFLLPTLLLLFFNLATAQNPSADAIAGNWLTANGKAIVKIYKEGNVYNGKITWLRNPLDDQGKPKVDKNNPDKAAKSQPLLGINLLKNFTFKDNEWQGGTIYDPENGKTYKCFIKYRDGKLDLRGYIGISLIGRTQTWYKAEVTKKS